MQRPRRIVAAIAAAVGLSMAAGCFVINAVGGASKGEPAQLRVGISAGAKALIRAAYAGIDHTRLMDYHVHVVGLGTGDSGAWVNPNMRSWLSPVRRVKFAVYADAAGIDDFAVADAAYVDRLTSLVAAIGLRGRYHLLAFDYSYDPDGSRNVAKSEFYTPNAYVFALAQERPDLFVPVMSVHPYRADALAELAKWAARGGKLVKWLPNAMGMNAADPRLDPYYAKLKQLGLVLLTHVGEEKAVEAQEDQKLGNPLLFRRPLDQGVTVIMAHCASLGTNEDLDSPGKDLRSNFSLFLRLMDEKKYDGLLFGEISAMTQFNRLGEPLTTMLRRTDLHPRLINGSDYPLPAINVVLRTSSLAEQGYLTAAQRAYLNEIYDYNPLLFDFVTKRTIRAPETGERFAPEIFYARSFGAPTAG